MEGVSTKLANDEYIMGNEQKKRIHSCSKFLDGTNGMVMPS
jgi:hypothetical protein